MNYPFGSGKAHFQLPHLTHQKRRRDEGDIGNNPSSHCLFGDAGRFRKISSAPKPTARLCQRISSDGYGPYITAVRQAFGARADFGQIIKTYSVTNLTTPEASRRYSPAEVVAVSREVVSGLPMHISTSYVERSNLTIRMSSRRFTRLTNGFSKKLENHCAAISLFVAHYNLCRPHESLRTTPAVALGITDRVWTIGELLDAALATQPITPTVSPGSDRRRRFRVIQGGKS